MAGVTIDIPGVGNVEAKNAATEATLREILKTLKGMGNLGGGGAASTGGAAAVAGGGAGGGVMSGLQRSAIGANKAIGALGKGVTGLAGTLAGGLGKGLGVATTALLKIPGAAMSVWRMFGQVAEASANLISDLANVGDSLTAAAGTLRNIPIVGGVLSTVLGAVAAAAEKSASAYKAAAASGATFGGSIGNFSRAASEAGMTIEQFGQLIGKNGQGMLGFGGTTEEGAKRFASVSRQLRSTNSELMALGFGTAEINQGLANYGALLRTQGLQGKKTNAEMAAGAKSYLKEMDALAKITGEERSAKEAQAKQLAADAQFQASMAGMNEEVRNSFRDTVLGLPGPLQNFTKDMLANGTATTEENQKILAMMPQSAAMLTRLQQKMQRGEKVTMEERNALNNMMKAEGAKNLKNIKQAGAASAELQGTVVALGATQEIATNGVIDANKAQQNAIKATDGQLKSIEDSKAKLAEFSNAFTQFLASSGLLDLLMKAFSTLANFTMQYVVPAFRIVAGILEKVWYGLEMLIKPIADTLKTAFEGLGGTVGFIDTVLNTGFTILNGWVRGATLVFEGLWKAVTGLLDPLNDLWTAIFGTGTAATNFADILIDIGSFIGQAFEFLGAILKDVIGVITSVIYYFKDLVSKSEFLSGIFRRVGEVFDEVRKIMSPAGWQLIKVAVKDFFMTYISDMFGTLTDWFGNLIDTLLNIIPNALGGISDEEKKKRDEAREERRKAREEAARARKTEVADAKTAVEKDAKVRKEKADAHKSAMREDSRKFAERSALEQRGIDTKKEQQKQEESLNKNYGDSLALLKDQAKQQKSNLVPPEKKQEKSATGVAVTEEERRRLALQGQKNSPTTEEERRRAEEERRRLALQSQSGRPNSPTTEEERRRTAAAAPANTNNNTAQTAEANRRQLEADAEKKRQEEANRKAAEAEKRRQEQDGKKGTGQPNNRPGTTQESAETLLASLNSKMDKLISINMKITETADRQLTVQQSFTGDLFRA